jgi:hypothetical protein
MDMEQLNLVELDSRELINIEGGNFLKKLTWYGIIIELANNWDAVKAGISDGWNGTYNNKF